MDLFSQLGIEFSIFLGILIFFIGMPMIRLWREKLPKRSEWTKIKNNISEWDLETIESLDLTPSARNVLGQVLTSHTGAGRHSSIPNALEYLSAIFEYRNRALKALSSLSVLMGLMATAFVLARAFIGRGGDIDMSVISGIYPLTFVSIVFAVTISLINYFSRRTGEKVLLTASEALYRLRGVHGEGADPALISALELVGERFQHWGDVVQKQYTQRIELLMVEVKELASAIRTTVSETIRRNKEDDTQTTIALRQLSERTELMSLRLDEGFKLLAQPFIQGVPAIQQLTVSAESLRNLTKEIMDRNLISTFERVEAAVHEMHSSVTELPISVQKSLEGVQSNIADATAKAVRESIAPLVTEVMDANFPGVAERMRIVIDKLNTAAETVPHRMEEIMAKVPGQISGAVSDSIDKVIEEHGSSAFSKIESLIKHENEGILRCLEEINRGLVQTIFSAAHESAAMIRSGIEETGSSVEKLNTTIVTESERYCSQIDQLRQSVAEVMSSYFGQVTHRLSEDLGQEREVILHFEKSIMSELSKIDRINDVSNSINENIQSVSAEGLSVFKVESEKNKLLLERLNASIEALPKHFFDSNDQIRSAIQQVGEESLNVHRDLQERLYALGTEAEKVPPEVQKLEQTISTSMQQVIESAQNRTHKMVNAIDELRSSISKLPDKEHGLKVYSRQES